MNNIPRAEHPNPQFERKDWETLNGEWEFEIDRSVSGAERKIYNAEHFSQKIVVPFCPESRLSGIADTDFLNSVWYKRSININDKSKRIILHFGAVDYLTTVYLNGEVIGTHSGGYTPFSFDITEKACIGENTLVVNAYDDVRGRRQPKGKQANLYYSSGCDYTRTTGIWQTVWLEYVPYEYIKSAKYYTDIENSSISIKAQTEGKGTVTAEAFYDGKSVGKASASSNGGSVDLKIDLSELHLWEPGHGRLYDLKLTYGDDEVCSYFGMRSLRLDGMKFLINEKPVFQRLVLDQGYYQDGIYTAPTENDLEKDIKLSLDMGFNGARLHQKVFEPRFLYHCDKLGYIVWGEYGNWGIDTSDAMSVPTFLREWEEAVLRDFNHPSIVGWCPFNETWDTCGRQQINDLLEITYKTTKIMDETRPCIDTSGNYHVITDIFDLHDYDQNPEVLKEHYAELPEKMFDNFANRQTYRGEPTFVSEYGGIYWNDSDENAGWGYGNAPKTRKEFIERYKGLTDALLDNEYMLGFCYTQLYDIEQEQNGLYTYDRRPKFDPEIIKKINERTAAIEK